MKYTMLPSNMLQATEGTIDENTTSGVHYLTVPELASEHLLHIIGTGLNQYWLPVMVVGGLCGNTLSLIVMLLSHNRTFTTCVYLAALAVSDNILLILGGHTWVATVINGE